MPVKELTDAFLRTLTWTRALKDVPEAEGERPIKQITYLNRLDRGLSLVPSTRLAAPRRSEC